MRCSVGGRICIEALEQQVAGTDHLLAKRLILKGEGESGGAGTNQ